jgi:hypothetical protein
MSFLTTVRRYLVAERDPPDDLVSEYFAKVISLANSKFVSSGLALLCENESSTITSLSELKQDILYIIKLESKGRIVMRRRTDVITVDGVISIPVKSSDYSMRGYLNSEDLLLLVENFTGMKVSDGMMFSRNLTTSGKVLSEFRGLEPDSIYIWEQGQIILQRLTEESDLIQFILGQNRDTIMKSLTSTFNLVEITPSPESIPLPPPPYPKPFIDGSGKKKKLRSLHWNTISKDKIDASSFWQTVQNVTSPNKLLINEKDLESIFSISPIKVAKIKMPTTPSKLKKQLNLLDIRRTNNTGILLSRLRLATQAIKTTLLNMEVGVLSLENLDSLSHIFPLSEVERKDLLSYQGDRSELNSVDRFYLEMLDVPNLENRISVLLFQHQFDSIVGLLRFNISTLTTVSHEIRNSLRFQGILRSISFLGNSLNRGTHLSSKGFKFDTLTKLNDTKGKDGKTSVLDYLVDLLSTQKPELLKFEEEIPHLRIITKMSPDCISNELEKIAEALHLLESNHELDKSKFLTNQVTQVLHDIKREYEAAMSCYYDTISFYAQDAETKPHQFFTYVSTFASAINSRSKKK